MELLWLWTKSAELRSPDRTEADPTLIATWQQDAAVSIPMREAMGSPLFAYILCESESNAASQSLYLEEIQGL